MVFDLLEVYAGSFGVSRAFARRGFLVGPVPGKVDLQWDLRNRTVFRWINWMLSLGRVWLLFWSPPCTTKSRAACHRSALPEPLWEKMSLTLTPPRATFT